ncbi:extra-cytoplasmic solute receptor [Pusillimonas sp. T7-7]|uniref:Bug family tripartite tricarboxylate transporter substrate binding protein n=1 Tax=Pusillimonas sp. (strain T7-7) TaxID=1007105 RepID=UPI00020855D4|nr:tripartite tricarboxylate transporter substrate binding protein [Pusillimonas sp. T7-7]AEC21988.1 extra-cytoplasmic solute receptor [Pusillimonas sp. T7-7]
MHALKKTLMLVGVATAVMSTLSGVQAQEIESRKQIRIIVPYSAGGTSDILGRKLAEELGTRLKRPVIVENKAGAGGSIGTDATVRADADGTTILLHSGAIATEPALKSKLPYDVTKDLTAVTTVVEGPFALLVNKDLPVSNLKEFLQYAKAHPGEVNFGTPGVGTSVHLASELFKVKSGLALVHVPYKGASAALTGLMGGEIQMVIDPLATAKRYSEDGRVKGLALTSAQRSELWPDMPTVAESGVPDYSSAVWYGLYVPAATPEKVVQTLNEAFVDIVHSPNMKTWLSSQGLEPVGNSPKEADEYLKADIAQWKEVVKTAGIPVQ